MRSFLSASMMSRCTLSVLIAIVSAPFTPSLCRRLIVLLPAPPHPTMTMRGSPKASNSSSWAWAPVFPAGASPPLNFMALALIDCIPSLLGPGCCSGSPAAHAEGFAHPVALPLSLAGEPCASRPSESRPPEPVVPQAPDSFLHELLRELLELLVLAHGLHERLARVEALLDFRGPAAHEVLDRGADRVAAVHERPGLDQHVQVLEVLHRQAKGHALGLDRHGVRLADRGRPAAVRPQPVERPKGVSPAAIRQRLSDACPTP